MNKFLIGICALLFTNAAMAQSAAEIEAEVADVERAFAKSMADRDLDAFASFLADDTIFYVDDKKVRGREAVVEAWRSLYQGEKAPFKWEPETVMANDEGTLALSTGPVSNDQSVYAYYTSIWRKNTDGSWNIIFDKGQKYCEVCAE